MLEYLETIIGSLGSYAFGDMFSWFFLILFFVIIIVMLRIPTEIALVFIVPLLLLIAINISIPNPIWVALAVIASIIIFLPFMRIWK
jgi:hypothetical protein